MKLLQFAQVLSDVVAPARRALPVEQIVDLLLTVAVCVWTCGRRDPTEWALRCESIWKEHEAHRGGSFHDP